MIKRNIIYMKGGNKEVHIQNINPKMLKIHCCKLWNQPPHQKKKTKKKVIIKQLWNKNQEKEMLYSLLTFC